MAAPAVQLSVEGCISSAADVGALDALGVEAYLPQAMLESSIPLADAVAATLGSHVAALSLADAQVSSDEDDDEIADDDN